ncbi:UDP-N-acetylmuramoyl-tripeptide--D-alanyl-D-alanine ligase [Paenibacillus sp. J2TS4]|uniref:UDP-N-acetylmuramoyl-tripeptide--D-alanyl-D- alanine ligase n=1 Tax=Paenibacillus sp. J2TS4 TaxID=2807194 RepID=UPI001B2955F6|nr:UDP-N-acetylmuramoyl-tripeptide--D-alanyl-D-alanine ligase [Paenibacillus sp. J2TS4]GIP33302.1 UDP-N-acetylmuramoyl-tripeptide--D-alanyl-D-alanine ligase [Paenibacillus sp. J2TS4]
MITRTLGQIAEMIGSPQPAESYRKIRVQGVSIDTRSIQEGNLFIPIIGDRFNGHKFVRDAFSQGAAAVLWDRNEPDPPVDLPFLLVDDTVAAMQSLARAYRQQLPVRIVGITGSNGKTSTKDMLAALLATRYKTEKTFGNLNNHLGVPLTLLKLEEDTEMAVVEMGMSGLGEIYQLSSIAKPDVAIITNVSEVHLGDLKTRERIVQAKLEILCGLRKNGLFIYNGDNPRLTNQLDELTLEFETASFGSNLQNTLYPTQYQMEETGIRFSINDEECPPLSVPLLGRHQMINALSAIAAARYFGVTYEQIQQGFLAVEATGMRNELIRAGQCLIINDAYKSNPTSLRAALDTLYSMDPNKRKIAVLGGMVELGEESDSMHSEIGEQLDPGRLDALYTIGDSAARIAQSARSRLGDSRITVCSEKNELIEQLKGKVNEDCVILFKGSRGWHLEEVVESLIREASGL